MDSFDSDAKLIPEDTEVIGFNHASFAWSRDSTDGFLLRIDHLEFKKGKINLIIGPTGSGKTAVLLALLGMLFARIPNPLLQAERMNTGEMHHTPTESTSYFSLPRKGGVAYAPQEPWIWNDTIKSNILFTSALDEERYKKVLYQCGLVTDLVMLDAGDATEVGEKGVTLSGGQKARISLARAVYASSNTVLLDDVLAALDSHTAAHIVERCLKGDLMMGRTLILVVR